MTFSIPMPLLLIWLTGLIGCGGYLVLSIQKEMQGGAKFHFDMPGGVGTKEKMMLATGAALMMLIICAFWPIWLCTRLYKFLSRKEPMP